ncbi:MAG: hypothetical protein WC059_02025 [Candidatus Paceibacterota bacterium]
MDIYKYIGILGLVLICIAMVVRKRSSRDILSFFGGIGLLVYSIYLKDLIFIILQSVYIIVVSFDYLKENYFKQSN